MGVLHKVEFIAVRVQIVNQNDNTQKFEEQYRDFYYVIRRRNSFSYVYLQSSE